MVISLIVMLFISPWFWTKPTPIPTFQDLTTINISKDIKDAKDVVTWERGKTNSKVDKIFVNWPIEVINKRVSIVMENIDINNYFFSGHPRERVGIKEIQKFSLLQLILFGIGLTNNEIKKYKKFLIIYSLLMLLLVFIFEWRTYQQTILLAVPFILIMALGLKKCVKQVLSYF